MTPDIRERAERLISQFGAAQPRNSIDRGRIANLISQALLEAHKAGREEAVKWLEGEAESSEGQAAYSILREAASAIRSLP